MHYNSSFSTSWYSSGYTTIVTDYSGNWSARKADIAAGTYIYIKNRYLRLKKFMLASFCSSCRSTDNRIFEKYEATARVLPIGQTNSELGVCPPVSERVFDATPHQWNDRPIVPRTEQWYSLSKSNDKGYSTQIVQASLSSNGSNIDCELPPDWGGSSRKAGKIADCHPWLNKCAPCLIVPHRGRGSLGQSPRYRSTDMNCSRQEKWPEAEESTTEEERDPTVSMVHIIASFASDVLPLRIMVRRSDISRLIGPANRAGDGDVQQSMLAYDVVDFECRRSRATECD